MVTFGIDASSANEQNKTGVQWYAHHLIEHMKLCPLSSGERVVLYSPEPLQPELGVLPDGWTSVVLPWRLPGWMQIKMSLQMLGNPPEVFFVPAKGLPRFSAKKTVTTIHDLGFLRRPDLWAPKVLKQLRSDHKRSVKKAALILTPSNFTKQEIIDLYHVPDAKIRVTPLAVESGQYKPVAPEAVQAVQQKFRISAHYFLFIGRLEKKKNVVGLIRAFEQFKASRGIGDPYELVLVGQPGFGFEEIKKFLDFSPVKDHIKSVGYVAGDDAVAIICGATAYVIPSWYEGFGLTLLEAMSCGTPVIASDIPPHRETCANAAILVPPNEPETLARHMEALIEDPVLREQLRTNGLTHTEQFSWDKTAELTWEALRSLV